MTGEALVLSFDAGSSKTSSSKAAASERCEAYPYTCPPEKSEQFYPDGTLSI